MWTFLILVKIMTLSDNEVHSFQVWSTTQMPQTVCEHEMTKTAEWIAGYVNENISARIQIQHACILQPTRET